MRVLDGIHFTDTEVRDFQERFVDSPGAGAIAKVLNALTGSAGEVLERPSASMEDIRVAQGVVLAVRRFDDLTGRLAQINLEEEEDELRAEADDDFTVEEDLHGW